MSLLFRVPIMCVVVLSVIFHIVLNNLWERIIDDKLRSHSLFTIIFIIVIICNMIFFCGMIEFCIRG